MGNKADCLKRLVCSGTVLLKDEKLARDLTYNSHELCCNSIMMNNMINKYQNWYINCQPLGLTY